MSRSARAGALRTAEFVPLAALLMSLVALAIDAMLPALPMIGRDLGVQRPNDVQYVITSLFFGLGLGQVLFGPLSDRIGRKPAIYAGLTLFMTGCLVSIFASSFEAMIAGRVLQGVGAAGPRIVTMALVRDQFSGRRMARLMSFVMAVFILVPALAPLLGQGILWLGSWRTIFTTFFAVAAVAFAWLTLRQPETLPVDRRRPFSVPYLSSAQQIFQEAYRTGAMFPVYFGVLALGIGFGGMVNGRLVLRHGMRRLSKIGATTVALTSMVAWIGLFQFDGLPPLWLFMAYLLVVFLFIGLVFGNLNALAMEPLGHIAGVGAAVVTSLSTLISVPLGSLIGQTFDGTLYTQVGALALFGSLTLGAMLWAEPPSSRRHDS